MHWIGVRKRLRPQLAVPPHRKGLGDFFTRELEPSGTGMTVDRLQVSQLVEKHVVEQESPNGEGRPLIATLGPELLRRLTFH